MSKVAVTITDAEGVTREISDIDTGHSLMEVSKQNDVAGVLGECGGAGGVRNVPRLCRCSLAGTAARARRDRGGHAGNA